MEIKATLVRIPGGMMVVRLLLAALINTFAPGFLGIGNFIQALFVDGASTLIALFLYFCIITDCHWYGIREFGS